MTKKLLLISVVALCLVLPVFTLGGGDKDGSSGYDGGPIGTADNPVTVTYLCKDVSITEPGVVEMVEAIEKGMAAQGMHIKLEVLGAPAGRYVDAVPIAYRTGQISPDLIYFQGGDLPIANEGFFVDLTSYIENSTHVKAIMQDHNKAAMENYPYLMWLAPARVQVPLMRGDWADELNSFDALMKNPTVDNYYAVLKEIKDKGIAPVSFTTDGGIAKLDSIFNHAFGVTATIIKDGGDWVYSKATDAEKEKLAFYAKLYEEDLLDNQYVTKTWETMEQAFYDGTAGMVSGTAGDVVNIYNNKMISTQGANAEIIVLPPAKGVSQAYQSVDVSKEPRGFAISVDSDVQDAAWAVLEFMASPEGRVIDKLGIEGVQYNMEGDKYVLTERFPEWWSKFWPTMNGLDTSKVEGVMLTKPAVDSLDAINEYFAADVNVLLPDELLPKMDAMNKLYTEYSTDIIRGVRPVSDFDEFVEKWNAAGGTEITEYLNSVL